MKLPKIIIAFLFAVALGLLLLAIFYPVPTEDELEMPEEPEEVVVPEIAPLEITTWKTSKDHFVIDIPASWEVSQKDTGGMSIVTIFNPAEPEVELKIYLGLSQTFDGVPIGLDVWMNEQLLDADPLVECEDTEIGGEEVTCILATFDDVVFETYFGQADYSTYFYISKEQEEFEASPIRGVLNTIDFNPTRTELRNATTIR